MSKGKLLAVCLLWLLIAASLALVYRFLWAPGRTRQTLGNTSSSSHYRAQVDLALDSYSGYALLRSPRFKEGLARERIRLVLHDDQADYEARLRALRNGSIPMGVFTIDALLTASAELGEMPAAMVAILDETRGADAILAYRDAFPSVDALNHENVRLVLTPRSPSETLARVVMSRFRLDRLPEDPFVEEADIAAVFERYRQAKPSDELAFVLWEPYVSRMRANPQAHVLTDSSALPGYIVHVLVASRDFLVKNQDVVRDVVGCYFRTAYEYRDRMPELLMEDARQLGTPLDPKQAETLAQGIWWKNTLENFAHFGLDTSTSLPLLEDMISNLTGVLVETHAIPKDPTAGKPNLLYFDGVLRDLSKSNFHPRLAQEQVRSERPQWDPLSDQEWKALLPLGTLAVPDLVFARGTDRLTASSETALDALAEELGSFPTAYLIVRGNSSRQGDADANRKLALRRAEVARDYLIHMGVDANRVRADAEVEQATGGSSVSFVLGRPPY